MCFYREGDTEVTGLIGAHVTTYEASLGLASGASTQKFTVTAPLPVIGLEWTDRFSESGPQGCRSNISASASKAANTPATSPTFRAPLDYSLSQHWSLGGGYERFDFTAKAQEQPRAAEGQSRLQRPAHLSEGAFLAQDRAVAWRQMRPGGCHEAAGSLALMAAQVRWRPAPRTRWSAAPGIQDGFGGNFDMDFNRGNSYLKVVPRTLCRLNSPPPHSTPAKGTRGGLRWWAGGRDRLGPRRDGDGVWPKDSIRCPRRGTGLGGGHSARVG